MSVAVDGAKLAEALRARYRGEAEFVARQVTWGRARYLRQRRAVEVRRAGLPEGADRAAVWRAAIDQLVAADG